MASRLFAPYARRNCECACHGGVLVITSRGYCCPCPDAGAFCPDLLVVKRTDD